MQVPGLGSNGRDAMQQECQKKPVLPAAWKSGAVREGGAVWGGGRGSGADGWFRDDFHAVLGADRWARI